jgi:hypothetical protein
MLDLLLAIIAILVAGACVGCLRLPAAGGGLLGWHRCGVVEQAYGAQSFRIGRPTGGLCGCGGVVAWTLLARPAPSLAAIALDGWSSGAHGPRCRT